MSNDIAFISSPTWKRPTGNFTGIWREEHRHGKFNVFVDGRIVSSHDSRTEAEAALS